MKTLICAAALVVLAALPAAAQYQSDNRSSDRYTRDPAQNRADQQTQSPERRQTGEIETLRRDQMSSPNVKGQQVPADTSTGAAAPEQRDQPKQTEGAIRP